MSGGMRATPPGPRFIVGETRGFRIHPGTNSGPGGNRREQASYAVLDSHVCYRRMAEYASEDRYSGRGTGSQGGRLGLEGARRKAEEHAARLEQECAEKEAR